MQQLRLFDQENYICKRFNYENIKAYFKKIVDDVYEAMIEVNSNKFLVSFRITMNKIEQFEILAIKGFVEISLNMINLIKRIVYKLYFEI